jgi:hypothetical protein
MCCHSTFCAAAATPTGPPQLHGSTAAAARRGKTCRALTFHSTVLTQQSAGGISTTPQLHQPLHVLPLSWRANPEP